MTSKLFIPRESSLEKIDLLPPFNCGNYIFTSSHLPFLSFAVKTETSVEDSNILISFYIMIPYSCEKINLRQTEESQFHVLPLTAEAFDC